MRINQAKAKLARGEPIIGAAVQFPAPDLVELLGYAGFDFVFVDAEHSPIGERDCEHMVRAAEVAGTTPLVRVPRNDPPTILRYLETGAQGVIVPNVRTAADARAAVQAARYPPAGARSMGMGRAARHAVGVTWEEYRRWANDEILVVLLVEHVDVVQGIHDILTVEGVDVILVGPGDLSASLGRPMEVDHPEVRAACDAILDAVIADDRVAGWPAASGEAARAAIARGVRFIMTGANGLIATASRAYLDAAHGIT